MPRRSSPASDLTWNDALDRYTLALRARRAAAGTIKEQGLDLGHLKVHFERVGLAPADVTLDDLRSYQVGLYDGSTSHSKRPLAARTVSKITTVVRRFFSHLVADELLARDPALRLELPRCPKKQVGDVLTVKEVTRLLGAIDLGTALGLRDRVVVEVLYATGVRRNELLALDVGDVDHHERDLLVRLGKGGRGRRVPLARSAYLALKDYLDLARPQLVRAHPDSATALFLSNRGRRLDHMVLVRNLRAYAAAAGIAGKRVTPHTFRRTAATHLLQGGASLRAIQAILGHRDLSTLTAYLKLDGRDLRREVLLRHPRERIDA